MAAAPSGHAWEANGRIRQLSGYPMRRSKKIKLDDGGANAASWITGLDGQAGHWPTMGV